MYKRFGDIIGNWGPQYGAGATAVFGQETPDVGPGPGAPMAPAGWGPPPPAPMPFPGYYPLAGAGFGAPWCGGPPAAFNPLVDANAVALGANCGPLALRKPLPFRGPKEVGPCERVTLHAKPQEWYKIEGLFINRSVACSVAVTGLTIGIQNMLSDCGGRLPGDMFTSDAENMFLNGYTAWPGQEICLEIENLTDQPLCVTAGLIGTVISGGFPHIYGNVGGAFCR